MRDGKTAGFIRFEGSVQEIFDVQLLGGVRRPDVLEPTDDHVGAAFTLPPDYAVQTSRPDSPHKERSLSSPNG